MFVDLYIFFALLESWPNYSKKLVEQYYPKFNIWYWQPNNDAKNQKDPALAEPL